MIASFAPRVEDTYHRVARGSGSHKTADSSQETRMNAVLFAIDFLLFTI